MNKRIGQSFNRLNRSINTILSICNLLVFHLVLKGFIFLRNFDWAIFVSIFFWQFIYSFDKKIKHKIYTEHVLFVNNCIIKINQRIRSFIKWFSTAKSSGFWYCFDNFANQGKCDYFIGMKYYSVLSLLTDFPMKFFFCVRMSVCMRFIL